MEITNYIDNNKPKFLAQLKDLLRFQSVSAQESHRADVLACAGWLVEHLQEIGAEAELVATKGNPIVRARIGKSGARRIIIYGHYDVQPVEPLNAWQSGPFEPQERNGYLYARGATDDKSQLFAHIKAVETLINSGDGLDNEILFLLEGEEECGGRSLEEYIQANKNELKAYGVVASIMAGEAV